MELSIGQVALYSQNKFEVSSFLCELFEATPISVGDNICIKHENFSILVIDAQDNSDLWRSDTMIDFDVESYETLEFIKQRIEFICYRHQLDSTAKDSEIKSAGSTSFFFAKDPDGRKWKFSCRS